MEEWTTKVINTFHTIIEENYEGELREAGKNFITVDFNIILNENPDIAEYLLNKFNEAITLFEIAAAKFVTGKKNPVSVRIINFPSDLYHPIWKLRAKQIGQLVTIKGYIRKISGVLHGVSMIKYACGNCNNIINIPQHENGQIKHPRCGCGNKNKDNFRELDRQLYDLQKIIIEEDPSLRSDTKKPQQLLVILKADLCEHTIDKKLQPSKKVEVSGIIEEKQIKPGVLEYKKYLKAHNIQVIEDSFASIKFNREEVKEYKEMCKSKTILQDVAQSIFPNIYGNQSAKEAIVLQLAGSPHLYDGNRIDERGTIMIFLISSPGAAKSQILKRACMFVPNSIYMDCKASSAAGMVAAVVKDSEIGDFTLDIGPMGLANKSMLCIEENQLILTKSGVKHIKDILPNEDIASYDNNNLIWNTVKYVWNRGMKQTIKIKTYTGDHLICTPNHKVLTHKGWVEAGKLTTKDFVKIPFKNPKVTNNTDFEQGFLSGFALSDIYCGQRYSLSFSASVKNKIRSKYIIKLLKKYYNLNIHTTQIKKQERTIKGRKAYFSESIRCSFNNKHLYKIIRNLFDNQTLHKTNESFKIGFLAGILSTDTCISHKIGKFGIKTVISITPTRRTLTDKQNQELLSFISGMLHSFGILSVIRKKDDSWVIIIPSLKSYNLIYEIFHKYLIGKNKKKLIPITPKSKICSYDALLDDDYVAWFKSIKFNTSLTVKLGLHSRIYRACKQNKVTVNLMQTLSEHWSQITNEKYRQPLKNYLLNKVISITDYKKSHVYDLTMAGVHNFMCCPGIVLNCGDEMDKMSRSDLAMMNTAMNDLRAIINKAQVHAIIETDTMVLGAANPKNRVFDKYLPIWKQIGLPKDFLDRFDLIFPLETIEDKDTQRHVANIILSKYKKQDKPKESLPIYTKDTVQKFIAYIRQKHNPTLTDEVSEHITEKFLDLFNPQEQQQYSGTLTGKKQETTEAYFSSRLITNLIRLTMAHARIKGRDTIRKDANVALGLLKDSLMKQQIITDKGLDTDKLEDIVPKRKRDKKRVMREIIKSLCIKDNQPTAAKVADAQEVVDEAINHFKFTEDEADEILALLKEHGEIYEPRRGKLRLI